MTPIPTAEIEAGLELAKKQHLPRTITHNPRAEETIIYEGVHMRARLDGRLILNEDVARNFILTAANQYEALAAEVLAMRKAVAAMNDARCRHNLEDLLKALDTALSGATP